MPTRYFTRAVPGTGADDYHPINAGITWDWTGGFPGPPVSWPTAGVAPAVRAAGIQVQNNTRFVTFGIGEFSGDFELVEVLPLGAVATMGNGLSALEGGKVTAIWDAYAGGPANKNLAHLALEVVADTIALIIGQGLLSIPPPSGLSFEESGAWSASIPQAYASAATAIRDYIDTPGQTTLDDARAALTTAGTAYATAYPNVRHPMLEVLSRLCSATYANVSGTYPLAAGSCLTGRIWAATRQVFVDMYRAVATPADEYETLFFAWLDSTATRTPVV